MGESGTKKRNCFSETIGRDQARDTGMVVVLVLLLFGYFGRNHACVPLAILFLGADLVYPNIYRPLAIVWFGLAHVLGTVMSKLILTVIFFTLVTPIGFAKRMCGWDPLQLSKWKQHGDGGSSVFSIRDHVFRPEDIEHPY